MYILSSWVAYGVFLDVYKTALYILSIDYKNFETIKQQPTVVEKHRVTDRTMPYMMWLWKSEVYIVIRNCSVTTYLSFLRRKLTLASFPHNCFKWWSHLHRLTVCCQTRNQTYWQACSLLLSLYGYRFTAVFGFYPHLIWVCLHLTMSWQHHTEHPSPRGPNLSVSLLIWG